MRRFLLGVIVGVSFCLWCSVASAEIVVIDDPDATITAGAGDMQNITWETNQYGSGWKYYGYAGDPEGSAELEYTASGLVPGVYKIYGTWAATAYNTTGGKIVCGSVSKEYVSTTPPNADAMIGGRPFELLGEVTIAGSTLTIKKRNVPAYPFGADAVAYEFVSASGGDPAPEPPAGWTIRDDLEASGGGSWVVAEPTTGNAYGGKVMTASESGTAGEAMRQFSFAGVSSGKYRVRLAMPHGVGAGSRMVLVVAVVDGVAVNTHYWAASYPLRATSGVEFAGAQWELFCDNVSVPPGYSLSVWAMNDGENGAQLVDAVAVERYGSATSIQTPRLVFAGAGAWDGEYFLEGYEFQPMTDDTESGGEDAGGGGPGGGGPGGGGVGGSVGDPWDVGDDDDETTTGDAYPAPWGLITGSQRLGPHVSVYQNFGIGTGADVYPAKQIQAWVNNQIHMDRTYNSREIQIGGRLNPNGPGESGADYFLVTWSVRIGRNGFGQVTLNGVEYNPAQRLPIGETYILAAIDYLLSDAETLPIAAGGTAGMVQDASDLYGTRWEAATRSLLEAIRAGLVTRMDWTAAIPRQPDASFDPGGTGGGLGGDWDADLPVNPDDEDIEIDTDGDGVPDYRDEDPHDPAKRGVKVHSQGDDANFFSRWGPEKEALRDRLPLPGQGVEQLDLESGAMLPNVTVPLWQLGNTTQQIQVNFNPDGSALGTAIASGIVLARAAQLVVFTWGCMRFIVRMFQSW